LNTSKPTLQINGNENNMGKTLNPYHKAGKKIGEYKGVFMS
jgi:predicted methyltransferase